MAELKTKANQTSVDAYISSFEGKKQEDAKALIKMFKSLTNEEPMMWGTSIVGFGNKLYTYDSGRQIDYFLIGFAVRKKALTIYLMIDLQHLNLDNLGKHDKGVGCLYIKTLDDIDMDVLKDLSKQSIEEAKRRK